MTNKKFDSITFPTDEMVKTIKLEGRGNVNEYYMPRQVGLFFNTKSKFITEKVLRQAISQTIDRNDIIMSVFGGEAFPAYYPGGGTYIYSTSELKLPQKDVSGAKNLLKNAKFKLNGNVLERNKKPVVLKVVTVDNEYFNKTANILASGFDELGIETQIISVDPLELEREYLRPRQYDIALLGQNLTSTLDLFTFWHSSQVKDPGLNLSNHQDRELDLLLEDYRKLQDDAKKEKTIKDIQKKILNENVVYYLYNPPFYFITSSRLNGPKSGKLNFPVDRFYNFEQWFVDYEKHVIDS